MAKEPCKKTTSKSGIETEIEVEGYSVFVTFTDPKSGDTVLLKLHRRASNAFQALLATCDGAAEDSGTMAVTLRGEMTLKRSNDNAEPPAI